MTLTTEQVFALGILYNKLATIVYGEDGPKANNLQNATMYPLMEIAQLILRANLTAQQVADKLGISLRQYQRIESGESKPTVQVAQTLASLFQCSVNDLF